MIKVKRVYDKADITDGDRILVDRLWPRGIRRSTPNIDVWIKDVAPSDELRKWFAHDPAKWKAFKEKYRKELASNKALDKLIEYINSKDTVTFLYSTKDTEHNNAQVLLEVVNERLKKEGREVS
ncbi:MAG: DUF488 family protein [Candidatus Marsarchaeota archaeon]|jgi:uncharacterized protein YeaO (DUF488 family)|nr:DUF488 family protein [Candidatus Marsarchaeota archaeon]